MLCSAPFPPPPLPWAAETTMTRTGWPAACHTPVTVSSWLQHCAGCWRCCRRGEEREGGGSDEACGIAGGGEEDVDRGREVHGGVDKDQCRREEEEGNSIGGRDLDGVSGVGGELGRGGQWQRSGTGRPHGRCPLPSRFGWGGLSSCPPLIVADPWTAMAQTVRIKSRRVIGVISR